MRILTVLVLACFTQTSLAQDALRATPGQHVIKDFRFNSGESLPEVKLNYRTFGAPRKDDKGIVRNAVLVLHGTTGNGGNFITPAFSGALFGPGQLLDASKYYIILPDNIGHGQSTKPSDGLHAKFPKYGYRDMIAAQHKLLTEGLGVNHLHLIIGTSMGGMHAWLWGQTYPDFMDGLIPLASLPGPMSGRNRMWRKTISDAIRTDPAWKNGEYTEQPPSLRTAASIMTLFSDNPVNWQSRAPTLPKADEVFEKAVSTRQGRADANDVLYAVEASWDYDPSPGLDKIKAPLLAINFADDLINPPELGILENEIKRVPRGKAVLIPLSKDTVGHGTHTKAAVWKDLLAEFMARVENDE